MSIVVDMGCRRGDLQTLPHSCAVTGPVRSFVCRRSRLWAPARLRGPVRMKTPASSRQPRFVSLGQYHQECEKVSSTGVCRALEGSPAARGYFLMVRRMGFGSIPPRPFQARLTRCAATSVFLNLRESIHHWPVSATMPTSIWA